MKSFAYRLLSEPKFFHISLKRLYAYRQRPDSSIRSDRFAWQMFKGRALCVDVAKRLSDRSAMVTVSAFADAAVSLFKDAQSFPVVDLKPYKALRLKAAEMDHSFQNI